MQTLKFLGRGSAFNVKEGNTSAYIKNNDTLLLIDCGESVFQKVIEAKLLDDIADVNVIITHLNSYHIGSLSSLIYYCYYIKQIKLKLYYPDTKLMDLLSIMGHQESLEYNYQLLNVTDNFKFIAGTFNIRPIKVPHIETLDCYGYILYFQDNTTVYYSGDCNNITESVLKDNAFKFIDEFYQDTCLADYNGNVHLSLRKLCEQVPKEYRGKVYCMHLDCDELIEKAKSEGFNVVENE